MKAKFEPQINLLIGLECDYISTLDLDQTKELLSAHPEIDYIVGSVHHVNGISIDFDQPTWKRAIRAASLGSRGSTMHVDPITGAVTLPTVHIQVEPIPKYFANFYRAYFDAQYDVLRTLKPEVIGHFDLCLLWTPERSLQGEEMDEVWEKVERNVKYAISYGALFEANSASLRKGWPTSYPSPDVLNVSRRVSLNNLG